MSQGWTRWSPDVLANLHSSLALWAGPSHPLGTDQFAPEVCLAATADVPQAAPGHSHNLCPWWQLLWNLLTDHACSLRKAQPGEGDCTSSLTRTTNTESPQCWDFTLPSPLKAGGKLGVATSISYNPGEPQGELSLHVAWPCCRGSMEMCQLYQSLGRASLRPNVSESDLARRNVLWYSMANQNQSRKLMLQSIVMNIVFLSFICSSHKKKNENWKFVSFWFVFV